MERKVGKGTMNQQKTLKQARYNNVETVNEGLGSANQRFLHDPSANINSNVRPPDYNMSVGARPVLNYSIQTGEEFALEFMNPRQHFFPNSHNDPNSAPGYTELKGIIGIRHTGSESGSEISMLGALEKGHNQEFERQGFTMHENQNYYNSMQSAPRTSSRNDSTRGIREFPSSGASGSLSMKLKFLCSFGGTILPRPSDGKLRYVGGETRVIGLSKNISWQELQQKVSMIYDQVHVIKYQLPGEDLDALVSVSSDEDLQNMMDECAIIGDGGSQKPRMFLFSVNDLEDPQLGLENMEGDSEFQYVVAVNGMDLGSRKSSINLASTSRNNLDELLSLNVDREIGRVRVDLPSGSTALNVPLSTRQSSQPLQVSASSAYDSMSQPYQTQKMHGNQQPVSSMQPVSCFPKMDGTVTNAFSVALQHGYGSQPSNHLTAGESLVPMPFQGYPVQQGSLHEDSTYGGFHVQNVEVSSKDAKMKRDNSNQKLSEPKRSQGLDKEIPLKELKMKRDGSFPKIQETVECRTFENENSGSLLPKESQTPAYESRQEAVVVNASPDIGVRNLPSKSNKSLPEIAQNSMLAEAVNDGKKNDANKCASAGAVTTGYGDPEADPTDFSYLEPPLVQRIFHSERIPREQAELNRLSKSDDSFNPQVLITQAHPSHSQEVTESVDKLHEGSVNPRTEQPLTSAKIRYADALLVEEGRAQSEKYKESADNINRLTFNASEGLGSNGQKLQMGPVIVNSPDDYEVAQGKDKETVVLVNPIGSPGMVDKHHEKSAFPPLKVIPLEAAANKDSDDNAKLGVQPLLLVENSAQIPASKANTLEVTANKDNDDSAKLGVKPLPSVENSDRAVSQGESGTDFFPSQQGDISVDINDRFPCDILSDIFSKVRNHQNCTGINPMHVDGAGLSLNTKNHDPKRWSYFRNLAQDQFVRKDVSLIDQDHPGFSSSLTTVEGGVTTDYSYPPLQSDGVPMPQVQSNINFDEDMQQEISDAVESDTVGSLPSHTNYGPSMHKGKDSAQLRGINSRVPESEYEHDGKVDFQTTDAPLVDLPFLDFDMSTLQIIKNEDLEELRELGSGTFGTVYHGKWRGTDVAIKRIKKSCFTGRSSEQERLTVEFRREAEILSKLHHPNVVAFYGVVRDGPGGTLATVTEFMVNGSLRRVLLSKDRHLDRRKRLIIAMDAAFGMEYLHSKNIVHFDLKCDNLLVNLKDPVRPICKVGDFGLSKIKRNTLVTGGVRGTLPWMAPELLNGSSSKVSEKVDVFSFGIVLWEILTGDEPYANMHYGAIIGGIVSNTLRPRVPSSCDPEWGLLMEQCWAPDPAARPSFTQIARRLRAMSAACQTKQQPHIVPK
ncbi:hypothetical protein K2173_000338 [Erythroxylum novogranatense]|uniref:Protein kinase domain-containing protein n=1 Tax=Erythroxylum novogranatense TaxID=1862640 RepID=A0AAV8SW02_9ROSI|nr:hypothetical protein K2173_000338 [Erythroxylum novogranatense]